MRKRRRDAVDMARADHSWRFALAAFFRSRLRSPGSAEIVPEEGDGLRPRLFRMLRMVRRALLAHETVIGVTIEDDLRRLAGFGQRVTEFVDFGQRNERVLATEECEHGTLEIGGIVDRRSAAGLPGPDHPTAIKWRGRVNVAVAHRRQKRDAAA